MAIAKLSIDLEARLASLQAGLDRAGAIAERRMGEIASSVNRVREAAAGVGSALTAAFSVAGLSVLTRGVLAVVDGLDAFNDAADATGASIENISALEDIASRTGTAFETVEGALLKLNQGLKDAAPGSGFDKALQAIGLSAAELRRVDPAEALLRVSQALAGFNDDADKARVVQELFGKSTRDVAGFLRDVAERGELNATVTKQQTAEAEALNRQLFALQTNLRNVARDIVSELLPAVTKYLEKLAALRKGSGTTIFGQEIVSEVQSARLTLAVAKVEDLKLALEKEPGNPALARALQEARADADALLRSATNANAALKDTLGATARLGRRPANEGGGGLRSRTIGDSAAILGNPPKTARVEKPVELAFQMDEATQAALRTIQQTDVAKIAALNAQLDKLFEMRASGAGGGSEIDEAIQRVRDQIEQLNPAAKAAAEEKRRLDDILAQTPQGVLAAVRSDLDLLQQSLEAGKITFEEWVSAYGVAIQRLPKATEQPLAEISEFSQQAARNIQDALGNSLQSLLEGNFSDIGRMWQRLLAQMASQAAAAQLSKYLLGNDFAKSGQVGGAIGDFFTWLGGLGTRASGGPVTAGRPYLVGEQGPEIIVPRAAGTVLPNGVMPAAMGQGGPTIVVQGDVGPRTLRLLSMALMQARAQDTYTARWST